MLRFFKILRFEASPRKYIWLAILEIFLVVIGIFIALQVNNLTEERKLRSIEKSVLIDLRSELYANISHLDSIINELNERMFLRQVDWCLNNQVLMLPGIPK